MDDPWGSPWTTSAAADRTPSPTKSSKSDLEPPPRAFLCTNGSPRLPAVSVDSPWADDNDGFGDWTGAETTTTSASGWGGGWGGIDTPGAHGQQHLTPTPKEDGFGFGQASPIAWPGSIASPNAKNGHSSAFRQPSPDPWTAEFDDFKEVREAQSTPSFVLDRPATPTPVKEQQPEASEEQVTSVWESKDEQDGTETPSEGRSAAHNAEEEEANVSTDADYIQDTAGSAIPDGWRPGTGSVPRSSHSRSSSTSRDDSDFEEDRQDSPITSIDEEGKSRLALPPRKVSGKIQVLVEKFDGLAKAAVDEPPPVVKRESSATPSKRVASRTETLSLSEEIADFGDFEDAEEVPRSPPLADLEPTSSRGSPERTPTPPAHSPQTPPRQRSPSLALTASPAFNPPTKKPKPPKFDVDLTHIDDLFNNLHLEPPASRDKVESALPDNIITDTFTQISERKAWYRISRLGSSRMHNSGEDSYRRVAWPTTTVHDETLKIVRRWMEQDSITGRTTLGGVGSRTNMFNWDSAAEPVALEQIFAKRRRQQPRPASLQQPVKMAPVLPPVPTAASGAKTGEAATKQRPMSLAGPTVAAFAWISSPVEPQVAEVPQPTQRIAPVVKEAPALNKVSNHLSSQIPAHPNPPAPQADEDDDWGEMVSSPPIDAAPITLPPLSEPQCTHTATTSLLHPSHTLPSLSPSRQSTDVAHSSIKNLWELPQPEKRPQSIPAKPLTAMTSPSTMSQPVPATRISADAQHSSIEDLWELPQPRKPPEIMHTELLATGNPPSYFDQPAKPTVPTSSSTTNPTFTPTTPLAIMSPLPVSMETRVEQGTGIVPPGKGEEEPESAVRQIVDNLPDLSYMLKR